MSSTDLSLVYRSIDFRKVSPVRFGEGDQSLWRPFGIFKMSSLLRRLEASSLLLLIVIDLCAAQATGEQCLAQFKKGQDDFILDTDESVKNGAAFLSSPKLSSYKDCVSACCKEPKCNVAVVEREAEEGLIKSCFLFDCLYKKKYVCRFVRKTGYSNYILETLYDSYLEVDVGSNHADHPPIANGGQDRVIQPYDSVTLNGIESKDDQRIASYSWTLVTPYPYAVIEKTNFEDQVIVSNLTSGVYKFKLTVTDSIGQADSTQVTVLVLTPEQSEHHCMVPMKVGPCRGSFPRWHYNAASGKCEPFTFGGCKENRNNYLSQDECAKACDLTGKGGSRGLIPVSPGEKCDGPCTEEQFTCTNKCCIEKELECDKTSQCSDGSDEQSCDDLKEKFRRLLEIPIGEHKVRCTAPPHTGSCRDSFSKWYYNPLHKQCFLFNYGGCKGNENRFDSKEQCMTTCQGVTEKDIFVDSGSFERSVSDSQTEIIAIAAVLGVGIFILLCILVYCLMKGKKTVQHHRVPVNNIPATSMDDRNRLVYNSTTKPI